VLRKYFISVEQKYITPNIQMLHFKKRLDRDNISYFMTQYNILCMEL